MKKMKDRLEEPDVKWVKLDDLRPGAVFVTRDGVRAVKTKYDNTKYGRFQCILLDNGEEAFFPDRKLTGVRELQVVDEIPDGLVNTEWALVAFAGGGRGIVMAAAGRMIESEVYGADLRMADDFGFDGPDAPEYGLWVWEGRPRWFGNSPMGARPDDGHFDYGNGSWREPTKEELKYLQDGKEPWMRRGNEEVERIKEDKA